MTDFDPTTQTSSLNTEPSSLNTEPASFKDIFVQSTALAGGTTLGMLAGFGLVKGLVSTADYCKNKFNSKPEDSTEE